MASKKQQLLDSAAAYLAAGLSIIPVGSDKVPFFPLLPKDDEGKATWAPFQEQPPAAATAEYWFTNKATGIGIVTGAVSGGLLVLDFDNPDGAADERFIAWKAAIPEHIRRRLVVVQTGKGWHVYLMCSNPPSSGKLARNSKKQPLIETRGEGGYVVAPPTWHAGARREYRVVAGQLDSIPFLTDAELTIVLDAAAAFDEIAHQKPAKVATVAAGGSLEELPVSDGATVSDWEANRRRNYAAAAWGESLEQFRAAAPGSRNDELFPTAARLMEVVNAGYYSLGELETALRDAAAANGYIADDREPAFQRTLNSAIKKVGSQALVIPPPDTAYKASANGNSANAGNHPSSSEQAEIKQPGQPEPAILTDGKKTDYGNAERMVELYGDIIRYVAARDEWLIWERSHWVVDDADRIMRAAKRTIRRTFDAYSGLADDDARQAGIKHALKSESRNSLIAMVKLAQSEPFIPIKPHQLDSNPFLLGVENGTLNLKTGQLQEPRQDEYITKQLPVVYDAAATCPTWIRFLDTVMGGNQRLIDYLQRAWGYSLTGSTREHCFFFMHGKGRNGKSTFMETFAALMGDYAQRTPTETILMKPGSSAGATPDLARMPGARLVIASEIEQGRRLSEPLVKDLTGGDTISARALYGKPFDFRPQLKLWVYGNHEPDIRGTDDGIWRRVHRIPFSVQIPEADVDKDMPAKLETELPGILNWALAGCLAWQKDGLNPPPEVVEATQRYKEDMDVLGDFFADCCDIEAGGQATANGLYNAYRQWARENGANEYNSTLFGRMLRERGFDKVRRAAGNVYYGLQLTDEGVRMARNWEMGTG